MKLSVWSSYYIDLSPEEMILEFQKHGYRHCELSDEHSELLLMRGDPIEVGKAFGAYAKEHDVFLSQGHLFLSARICKEDARALLKRQIELFLAIGIRYAVLHCDPLSDAPNVTEEERFEKNAAALEELLAYIGDRDLVICLENLRSVCASAEELLAYVERLHSPHLAICLDTGHLNITKKNSQAEFIRATAKHLKALHIADNEGERDQHLMPFGCGSVDVAEVVKELKAIGYTGIYNLEIPGERHAPKEIRGFKLAYIKAMFSYIDEIT